MLFRDCSACLALRNTAVLISDNRVFRPTAMDSFPAVDFRQSRGTCYATSLGCILTTSDCLPPDPRLNDANTQHSVRSALLLPHEVVVVLTFNGKQHRNVRMARTTGLARIYVSSATLRHAAARRGVKHNGKLARCHSWELAPLP
jgi:hypothetical protein